jgi:uncharacterized protein
MDTISPRTSGSVTVCITQHVRKNREADFEAWLRGIGKAAKRYAGHQGINVIRPAAPNRDYTYIFRFDNYAHLQQWERSAERAHWVRQLADLIESPAKKQFLTGLEYWFTLPKDSNRPAPPRYKMAALTVMAIYPLTTLLGWLITPGPLSQSRLLKGLIVSVAAVILMTYLIMPRVTRLFANWLYPARSDK